MDDFRKLRSFNMAGEFFPSLPHLQNRRCSFNILGEEGGGSDWARAMAGVASDEDAKGIYGCVSKSYVCDRF